MLHWTRWRERVSGVTWADRVEVKSASFWLREGGGWEECMEMGGASTGGITNVNLNIRRKCKINEKNNSEGNNFYTNWKKMHKPKITNIVYLSMMSLSMSSLFSMLRMAFFTAQLWNHKLHLFCHCENRQLVWPERPHSPSKLRLAGPGLGPGRNFRKSRTSWPYMGLAPQRRSFTRKIKSSRLSCWSLTASDNHDC